MHISNLIPDPANPRSHGARNLGQIAHSLQTFGPARSIAIDEDDVILAGNGVVEAAMSIGIEQVRVYDRATGILDPEPDAEYIFAVRVSGLTDLQKREYAVADNRTAELAEWDAEILQALSSQGVNLSDWWFDDELAMVLDDPDAADEAEDGDDNPYSQKIDTPVYTPGMAEPPDLAHLTDTTKRDELVAEIRHADIPEPVRAFLLQAAERHVVFDYQNIAEYYAHANEQIQQLMERSALVIIDVDDAIEHGYVRARDRFLKLTEDAR